MKLITLFLITFTYAFFILYYCKKILFDLMQEVEYTIIATLSEEIEKSTNYITKKESNNE